MAKPPSNSSPPTTKNKEMQRLKSQQSANPPGPPATTAAISPSPAAFSQIFVRTTVQLDPDSDLFMQIAQRAYREHEQSLVPCKKCGRKFFPHRIDIHERGCNANSPSSSAGKKANTNAPSSLRHQPSQSQKRQGKS